MKHLPFESIYRSNYEVVEERQGHLRLYPHTQQLPVLLRALNLEFHGGLPGHIARVDRRGDGFHKLLLRMATISYCQLFNDARKDELRLFPLPDPDLVYRLAVVQQITEETRRGPAHRFRFYAGPDFSPEIRLSGKRLVFADHVLERFSTRVPNHVGADLSNLLHSFYARSVLALPVGPGYGLIFNHAGSILAFPFKETDAEFFITTCLTTNEINTLRQEFPPRALNFHYGETFVRPTIRHWLPTEWMLEFCKIWERKVPLPPLAPTNEAQVNWPLAASRLKDVFTASGHGPGSRVMFLDQVVGPCVFDRRPGEAEPRIVEADLYKKALPGKADWDAVFAGTEPPRA
jgi:hypothetical protein